MPDLTDPFEVLASKTWAQARAELAATHTPDQIKAQAAMLAADGQEIVTVLDRANARRAGGLLVRHAGIGALGIVFEHQLGDPDVMAGWILVEDHRSTAVGRPAVSRG
jgi:hypothetical protein